MFFETKINRFKVDRKIEPTRVENDFDLIDNYKREILKNIFTKIEICPTNKFDIFIQSRVQMFLSQTLLRSLFLKDEMVCCLNSNNFPAFYAIAKSFLEIPAQLGYLNWVICEDKTDEEIQKELNKLVFAHKGGLTEIKGRDPINIMTMFDKLDIMFKRIDSSKQNFKKPLRTLYEDVCNFGHPNFMAHLPVGKISEDGYWIAKDPKKLESYKYELYDGFYMHYLTIAINVIHLMISMLNRHPKINNFNKINSPQLDI